LGLFGRSKAARTVDTSPPPKMSPQIIMVWMCCCLDSTDESRRVRRPLCWHQRMRSKRSAR
jgi:hypothetical protein